MARKKGDRQSEVLRRLQQGSGRKATQLREAREAMAQELADNENLAVAVLIVTFSVLIPVLKLLVQLLAFALSGAIGQRLLAFNSALGKWSMADVFVMAMLIAFMAGRASNHVGELLIMDAQLEEGFWYFLAYCLFAIAAGSVLQLAAKRSTRVSQDALRETV